MEENTSPQHCPKCSAEYRKITWNGGSPPFGTDHWVCEVCGHEWSTGPVRDYDEWRKRQGTSC